MLVRVLFFAAHRETMGSQALEILIADGATVEELFLELVERVPAMSSLRRFTTFAVNREVTEPGHVLCAGDEVALLQPLSGG